MSNKEVLIRKERRFKVSVDFFTLLKIFFIILLLIGLWYILYRKYIYVYLVKDKNQLETIILSIMVSITLMLFLIACGITFTNTNLKLKIFIFIIVFYLIYLGFTDIGIGIDFRENFELLRSQIYESNSSKGIDFFVLNYWSLWLYVYIITLFLEHEG